MVSSPNLISSQQSKSDTGDKHKKPEVAATIEQTLHVAESISLSNGFSHLQRQREIYSHAGGISWKKWLDDNFDWYYLYTKLNGWFDLAWITFLANETNTVEGAQPILMALYFL